MPIWLPKTRRSTRPEDTLAIEIGRLSRAAGSGRKGHFEFDFSTTRQARRFSSPTDSPSEEGSPGSASLPTFLREQESRSPAGARPGAAADAKVESRRWRHGDARTGSHRLLRPPLKRLHHRQYADGKQRQDRRFVEHAEPHVAARHAATGEAGQQFAAPQVIGDQAGHQRGLGV